MPSVKPTGMRKGEKGVQGATGEKDAKGVQGAKDVKDVKDAHLFNMSRGVSEIGHVTGDSIGDSDLGSSVCGEFRSCVTNRAYVYGAHLEASI